VKVLLRGMEMMPEMHHQLPKVTIQATVFGELSQMEEHAPAALRSARGLVETPGLLISTDAVPGGPAFAWPHRCPFRPRRSLPGSLYEKPILFRLRCKHTASFQGRDGGVQFP
jgi:hypothetical protein